MASVPENDELIKPGLKQQDAIATNYNNYTYSQQPSSEINSVPQYNYCPSASYVPYYPYSVNYSTPNPTRPEYFIYGKYQLDNNIQNLDKLLSNIDRAIRDQTSCRLLQKKLDENDNNFRDKVFEKLLPCIELYMNDPFGNYLCQKLFDQCNPDQLKLIIDKITPNMVSIAISPHGTRSIQKLIEKSVVISDILNKVVKMLKTHVTELVKDNNGNHVLQQCLMTIKNPDNEFIYEEVVDNCLEIATHKHGCCFIQKCIDYANECQKVILKRYNREN